MIPRRPSSLHALEAPFSPKADSRVLKPQSFNQFNLSTYDSKKYLTYMNAANQLLFDEPFESLTLDNGCYQYKLIRLFNSRVRQRLYAKLKAKKINATTKIDDKTLAGYITEVIDIECKEVITAHVALNFIHEEYSVKDLNAYKYENTWFKNCKIDYFLEIVEVFTDAVDKGNSFANKITHMFIPNESPADSKNGLNIDLAPNDTDPTKNVAALSVFQIFGFFISGLYLFISIITPLYKKYKLGSNDPIINKWSLRYFIPSVVLLGIGITAAVIPIVGLYVGIVFSVYSLANNIFKVYLYFKDRRQLREDIKKNNEEIQCLQNERDQLNKQLQTLKKNYLLLSKNLANNTINANRMAKKIARLENEYKMKLFAAEAQKEVLDVKRIKTLDNLTGVTNVVRLALAALTVTGVILTLIPGTQLVGATILFVALCVGTTILAMHWVNKFRLTHQEKTVAIQKAKQFNTGDIKPTYNLVANELKKNPAPKPTPVKRANYKQVTLPAEYKLNPIGVSHASDMKNISHVSRGPFLFSKSKNSPAHQPHIPRVTSDPDINSYSFGIY